MEVAGNKEQNPQKADRESMEGILKGTPRG